jgi:hypothetical protein
MEPEESLPCLDEAASGSYPEPDEYVVGTLWLNNIIGKHTMMDSFLSYLIAVVVTSSTVDFRPEFLSLSQIRYCSGNNSV